MFGENHNNTTTTTNENAPWVLSLKHRALGRPSRKKEANLVSVSSQATLWFCKLGFPGAQPCMLPSVCPWLLLHWNPRLDGCNGSDAPAKPKYLLWSAGEKSRRFLPWGINEIGEILLVFSLFYMVAWGKEWLKTGLPRWPLLNDFSISLGINKISLLFRNSSCQQKKM